MNQSEQINEILASLLKAQREIKPAIKSSVNPFFKSKYADLKTVFDACQESLNKYDILIMQPADIVNGKTVVRTTLYHISGQWISSILPVVSVKEDSQSMGSALSYARRYALASIIGVVTVDEDDDGNEASRPEPKPSVKATADSRERLGFKPSMKSTSDNKEENKKINYFQANELKGLLEKCSENYQINFWKFLKSQVKGIERIEDLPQEMYVASRTSMLRNIGDSEEKYA